MGWYSNHDKAGDAIVSDFAQSFVAVVRAQGWEAERIAQNIANEHNEVEALKVENARLLVVLEAAIEVDKQRWHPTLPAIQISINSLQRLHEAIARAQQGGTEGEGV